MINTDKYEGHYTYHESSVELWNTDDAVPSDYDMFWVTNSNQLNADTERANATTNLIQDAPLLLAEVKRLREEQNIVLKYRLDLAYEYIMSLCSRGWLYDFQDWLKETDTVEAGVIGRLME